MARNGSPDDPNNYSDSEPTQYANYGGTGGEAYSEVEPAVAFGPPPPQPAPAPLIATAPARTARGTEPRAITLPCSTSTARIFPTRARCRSRNS